MESQVRSVAGNAHLPPSVAAQHREPIHLVVAAFASPVDVASPLGMESLVESARDRVG